ncbi:hypothetical protein SGLAM104S_07755 [Streptomyces glaucescens]
MVPWQCEVVAETGVQSSQEMPLMSAQAANRLPSERNRSSQTWP